MACRVNAVCPGPILTEGTQRHADSQGVSLEAACQDMIGRMVMPRWVMRAAPTTAFSLPGHRGHAAVCMADSLNYYWMQPARTT